MFTVSFHHMHTQQGIVRLLRQSDAQLFAGWGAHPGISDGKILERIDHIADKAAMLLNVSAYSSLVPMSFYFHILERG